MSMTVMQFTPTGDPVPGTEREIDGEDYPYYLADGFFDETDNFRPGYYLKHPEQKDPRKK